MQITSYYPKTYQTQQPIGTKKQCSQSNSTETLIEETAAKKILNKMHFDSVDKIPSINFKSKALQVIEPMNFKTNGLFNMIKELFEIKSKLLFDDICKFKQVLIENYPNYNITLPIPVLGINCEAYGNDFQLLRIPNKDSAEYLMVVSSNNKQEQIEFKDGNLIANFNPKTKGLSLNEYILMGLESQLQSIKTQEKIDKIEADYKLRDSKLSEYIDESISNVQKQLETLKNKVNKNSKEIEEIQRSINYINDNFRDLKNCFNQSCSALSQRIHEVDTKYIVELKPWNPLLRYYRYDLVNKETFDGTESIMKGYV